MDTKVDYLLEDDRAILRPLKREDFNLLLPFALHEPELWEYSLTRGDGEANMKKYIEMALRKREEGDSYPFLVIDKSTNEVAGTSRFYNIQPQHNTLQLGYTWYGNKFQGTGLNKHCKYLLLGFAFEQLGVDRVEFRADANNARSIAAMKSIGCTVEGILRSNCKAPDGRRDSIVLSILRKEWFDTVRSMLQSKLTK